MDFKAVLEILTESKGEYFITTDKKSVYTRSQVRSEKNGTWRHNTSDQPLGKLKVISKVEYDKIKADQLKVPTKKGATIKPSADEVYGGKQRDGRGLGT